MNCPHYLSIHFPPETEAQLSAQSIDCPGHLYLDKFLLFQVSRCGLYNWDRIKKRLETDDILSENKILRTKPESWLKNRYYLVLNVYSKLFRIPVSKLMVSTEVEPYDFKTNFKHTIESSPTLSIAESNIGVTKNQLYWHAWIKATESVESQ